MESLACDYWSPRMRRATLASIGLAAIVAACGGGAATSGPTGPAPSATPPIVGSPSPTVATPASSPTIALPAVQPIEAAGGVAIGDLGQPDWLVVAGGSAWAAGVGTGIGRLDGKTGKLLESVAVPGGVCLAMDVGFDAVWVGSCGQPTMTRIDPRTSKVVASIPLSVSDLREESSVAAGEGGVWVLSAQSEGKLLKIDPKTNKVASTIAAPPGAAAIRAAFGGLWVTVPGDGTLKRLDPKDGSVVASIPIGSVPRFLAVGSDGVWVMNQGDATVSHVDPKTNKVVATIPAGSGGIDGGDIAVGGGSVWVRVSNALIARIDATTDTVPNATGRRRAAGALPRTRTPCG